MLKYYTLKWLIYQRHWKVGTTNTCILQQLTEDMEEMFCQSIQKYSKEGEKGETIVKFSAYRQTQVNANAINLTSWEIKLKANIY